MTDETLVLELVQGETVACLGVALEVVDVGYDARIDL